jgi:hypothetical protein
MADWKELDPAIHRDLRVEPGASARFGDDVCIISVLPCEYPRLVAHYPIFLRKSADTGQFEPAVLLGFSNRENLFLVGERWDAEYVPLQVQRQPFTVVPAGDGSGAPRVAFDPSSPRVLAGPGHDKNKSEAVFDESGQPTAYLKRVMSILNTFVSGAREALAYAAALAELELIEPVRIDAQFVDGSDVKLQGLYSLKAEGLQSLAANRLVELRDGGFLRWAYYQMASAAHVSGLLARKNRLLSGLEPGRAEAR